jgi:uncharacterized protein (DUF1684 family)
MSTLEHFRQEKDHFFKSDPNSPLSEEQKLIFDKLEYYPEDPELNMDLHLELIDPTRQVMLITSTGDRRNYLQKGQETILQVYEDGYGGYFLPFVDATAPQETYGAGRYLEPEEVSPGTLHVDFNLAYNPFCAYNDRWSCPIPPHENRLKVRIEAGEKKFH